MVRIYDSNQVGMVYLSPYTSVMIQPDQLIIHQTLFSCTASLNCPCEWSERLLSLLKCGVAEQDFLNMLREIMALPMAQELLDNWLRMGVLE